MINVIRYSAFIVLILITSCSSPRIDENYAASVVKKELSVCGNLTARDLKGGLSGAKLFLVSDGSKNYVVRFINNKSEKDRETEIYNLKVAEAGGYGPEIYFADSSRGIIIMEYLPGKKITPQYLQSDQFCDALALLLQKIHRSQPFMDSGFDVFKRIDREIKINKSKYDNFIPLTTVEKIITVIHQALLPYLTTAPCHNDLNTGNLIFLGNEFKAIDYEDAGPGDPFFDVATVAYAYWFHIEPACKKVLLDTYLGRQPTEIEEAKFYLMKQVVLIKSAFDDLSRVSPETVYQYALIKTPPFEDLIREIFEGKFDFSKSENNLILMKAKLNLIFENSESQEFKDAVNLLSEKKC